MRWLAALLKISWCKYVGLFPRCTLCPTDLWIVFNANIILFGRLQLILLLVFEIRSDYVAQAGLEHTEIYLPLPSRVLGLRVCTTMPSQLVGLFLTFSSGLPLYYP